MVGIPSYGNDFKYCIKIAKSRIEKEKRDYSLDTRLVKANACQGQKGKLY